MIGKRAREVAESDALAVIAGYSVFNDVSARDLQLQTSQWAPGKAIDTFAPMGAGNRTGERDPRPARFDDDDPRKRGNRSARINETHDLLDRANHRISLKFYDA